MQDQLPGHHSKRQRLVQSLFSPSVRGKIVLPYLFLTLVVAVIGTYVVTSLVASSLDERLTNQLLEAGRVVSDSLARREISHLEAARVVAYTRGMDKALQASDQASVLALAQPIAAGLGIENLIVVDAQGREMLNVLKQPDGSLKSAPDESSGSTPWIVGELLKDERGPAGMPRRGLGLHPADQRYYYFTAIPVGLGDQVVGVVIVGASLDTLLAHFKAASLADVIVYLDGRAIATTFALQQQPDQVQKLLDDFSIALPGYASALRNTESTAGENIQVYGREYRLARGPLRVGSSTLGVFAVVLPSNFIIEASATSRTTYSLLFTVAMACVILIGFLIARRITSPLNHLVQTSRAVAGGDLKQRTGLYISDEIGVLATTFDGMTAKLEERTTALEELLQKQKETAGRLQAILASIGDGVLLGDLNGNFIPMNVAAQAILQEMADNFRLGQLQELSREEPQAAPQDVWPLERQRFQLGQKVISTHSAPVQTEDGKHIGTVIVLQDVTTEAEAEQLKDAFVAHVSHELRTPLTVIKGYSDLLFASSGEKLDDMQRNFLQTISRHTNHLMEMINGLLDFSEMEAKGRLGLQREPVHLSTLVKEIAKEWQPRMAEKGLTFQMGLEPGLPQVEADTRRLRWAFINLVRNAWQHTPSGQVTLRLTASDGRVVFDVVDSGVGISNQDQQKLFTRFYRGAPRQEDETRGLGLGLYVTRIIVEAHGGEIRFVSEQGSGSTFSVIMPALPSAQDGIDQAQS